MPLRRGFAFLAIRAGMHLDGDVDQVVEWREELLVVVRIAWLVGDQGHYCGEMARADSPDMEIGDAIVGVAFDCHGDRGASLRRCATRLGAEH